MGNMNMPVIKQVKGTFQGILFIVIGSALAAISYGGISGELKGWHDLRGVVDHGLFAGVCMAAGWIVLKSPFAPQFQTFLGSVKESTDAAGVVTKEAHVEIGGPPPAPGASKTTVIDPSNQTVTIKEEGQPKAE